MRKALYSFLMAVISVGTIHAQADALKETFDDAEYFLQQEEYNEALSGYLKIYKRGFQQNGNINYRIGICYINSTIDKTKAITYLETAVKNISPKYKEGSLKETKAPFDAYLYLANAYRINLDFDKAINAYNQYNELAAQAKREVAANIAYSKIQIKACKRCKEAINRPQRILVTNIGKPINTTAANYNPAFSADGNVIAYMTKQRFYDAVMISHKVKGKWTEPDNITPSIQSDGNQYVCSLSPDGKTLFLSKEDNFNSDIYTSQFDGTTWSVSKPLGKEINTKFWESHASITADGKYLYFSSNRKTLSKGGTDIFVSKMVGGLWQPAENLGGVINTEWNEDAPFISPDGNTLYFSSQGHEGYGGYDIYYSVKVGKDWSKPINLGYPANTPDDDLFFCPTEEGNIGYMAKHPKDGFGDLDIVRVEIFSSKHPFKYILTGNSNTILKNQDPSKISVYLLEASTNKLIDSIRPGDDGKFKFKASAGNYIVKTMLGILSGISKPFEVIEDNKVDSYDISSELTDLSEEYTKFNTKPIIEQPVAKKPEEAAAKKEKEIAPVIKEKKDTTKLIAKPIMTPGLIKVVFFSFDIASLSEEATKDIENLAILMKDNPSLNIEIIGHTDSIGHPDYNQYLSEQRAIFVKNKLVQLKVAKTRIKTSGKGKTQPLAINTNPKGRAYNRRAEFKIIKCDNPGIKIEQIAIPSKLKVSR